MTRKRHYLFIFLACMLGYTWLTLSYLHTEGVEGVCLIKRITGVPCPSCGSTRAILLLVKGDIAASLKLNPLGIISGIILVISPVWMSFDWLLNRSSAMRFYIKVEKFISRKRSAVPLALLLLGNWVWNILKGL